jgi:hypothetical protein
MFNKTYVCSERIYGWLLRLYPARFRTEYGASMRQVFSDRLRSENRVRLWLNVLADVAVSIPREHRRPIESLPAQPGVYRFTEEAVHQMRRHGHYGMPGWIALCAALAFAAGWAGGAAPIPLIVIYSAFALLIPLNVRNMRRMWDHWRGFELVLEEDRISLKLRGTTQTTLLRSEIAKVTEEPEGYGLAIEGMDTDHCIWAPSLLSGYADLREHLSAWTPITELPRQRRLSLIESTLRRLRWLPFLFFPAAMLAEARPFILTLGAISGIWLLFMATQLLRRTVPWPMKLGCLGALAAIAAKVAAHWR